MKRSQPRRNWLAAREKCDTAQGCRRCGKHPVEAAHIIGREHDKFTLDGRLTEEKTLFVQPDRICPLCPDCHRAYDAGDLDLLSYLTLWEQSQALVDAGGLEAARRRLAPSQYRSERAA